MVRQDSDSLISQIFSASIGASITALSMTPFDVIKTRMQISASTTQTSFQTICQIIKNEGLIKLWRGLLPTLGFVLPQTVIYLVSYERIKDSFDRAHISGGAAYAGAISRGLAVSLVSPIELVKTRIQSQTRPASWVINQTLASMRQNGIHISNLIGISVLWRGLAPTLARDVPFSAIYWYSMESAKSLYYNSKGPPCREDIFFAFVNGSVSGLIAAIATHPFDVIKTLQQVSDPGVKISDITRSVYKDRGLSGFWAGLIPRVAKIAPACGIMISSYEFGKRHFRRYGY